MKLVNEIKPWSGLWKERISEDTSCIDPAYWSNTAREYDRKIVANGKLLGKSWRSNWQVYAHFSSILQRSEE